MGVDGKKMGWVWLVRRGVESHRYINVEVFQHVYIYIYIDVLVLKVPVFVRLCFGCLGFCACLLSSQGQ